MTLTMKTMKITDMDSQTSLVIMVFVSSGLADHCAVPCQAPEPLHHGVTPGDALTLPEETETGLETGLETLSGEGGAGMDRGDQPESTCSVLAYPSRTKDRAGKLLVCVEFTLLCSLAWVIISMEELPGVETLTRHLNIMHYVQLNYLIFFL